MNRVALVAVAALVLVSGCNAFGGNPTVERTVTPVDVPDLTPSATSASTLSQRECLAPRPETPTSPTPSEPTDTVDLPREDGTVDGDALVDLHVRALTNYSYRLRVDENTEVRAIPDVAAFSYEGNGLGLSASRLYAVGGTLYTLDGEEADLVLGTEPYGVESDEYDRYRSNLTGQHWLAQRVGFYEYTVVDTRTWNGSEVRVLQDTVEGPTVLGPDGDGNGEYVLNSTVYVDRRGVVRYVDHVRHIEYGKIRTLPALMEVDTFRVDDVGQARVRRPAAFCVTDSSTVRTVDGAVSPSATATTADVTG